MLETHEKEIDGRRYVYQPLMLKPARALFDKLVQRFGPAVATAVEKLQDAELTEEMELGEALGHVAGSAGGLIRGIVTGLDAKMHAEISDTIAKQIQVQAEDDNTKLVPLNDLRELLFGRNLLTEFKVIAFALETQYWDFLEPLRSLSQSALAFRAKAGLHSNYRRGSTGTSNESLQAQDTPTA
jgi:hypothetical protein